MLGFDPDDAGFIADPYPAYERLRGHGRVLYDDTTDHWLVPRFDDVNSLLRDRRFGRTYLHLASHEEMGHPDDRPGTGPFWHLIRHGILDMEPPDHTRVRRLVAKAFTPRMVESMREPVQRLTDDLIDEVAGAWRARLRVAGVAIVEVETLSCAEPAVLERSFSRVEVCAGP